MRAIVIRVLLLLVSSACAAGPTEREINDSLEATLRSVEGDWTGVSTGENPIRVEFRLAEGSGGQVSGSGTMKEEGAASTVPITVSGTFQRPILSLAFAGMVYDGRAVQGTATGDYASAGGISTTLQLSGEAYSRSVQILLQEK